MTIARYSGNGNSVQLGDVVSTRIFFFFKRTARVVYVPGVSKKLASLEHNGLQWIGLESLDGKFFQGALVDPETGIVDKDVQLIERGEPKELPPDQDPFFGTWECF